MENLMRILSPLFLVCYFFAACDHGGRSQSSLMDAAPETKVKATVLTSVNRELKLKEVELEHITDKVNLTGKYVRLQNCQFDAAVTDFKFPTDSKEFNCVQAYYHITHFAKIYESLGVPFGKQIVVYVDYQNSSLSTVENPAPLWASTYSIYQMNVPNYRNMLHYPEVLAHELTHVAMRDVIFKDKKFENFALSGSLNEGFADLMGSLLTGMRQLAKGSRTDKDANWFKPTTNEAVFGRENNNSRRGYSYHNPLVSSIIELADMINADTKSDLDLQIAQVAVSTLKLMKEGDTDPDFFRHFKQKMNVNPDLAPYLDTLNKILENHGLNDTGYLSAMFVNGLFTDRLSYNDFFTQDSNNEIKVTISPGLASDPNIKLPIRVVLYHNSNDINELTQLSQCVYEMMVKKHFSCADLQWSSPYSNPTVDMTGRLLKFETDGTQKQEFTLKADKASFTVTAFDSDGKIVANQEHNWLKDE